MATDPVSISTENSLVLNQGKSPLVSYNFMLRVEGIYDLPCKSVQAFSRQLEYDYIQEGGLNDYVHMLRKPISSPFTLEIERYVGVDYVDPLPEGADLLLPIILMVSRYPQQSTYVPFVCARTYVFTGCSVIKKTYGVLDGYRSDLLVETTTIAYREFSVINAPWSESALEGQVSAPSAEESRSNILEDMKSEVEGLLEKAEAAKKESEQALGKADTIKENLSKTSSDIQTLQKQLETTLDTLYTQSSTLLSQKTNAEKGSTSEESKKLTTELSEKIAQVQQDANTLEGKKKELELLASRISDTNHYATGENNFPNRLTEASESDSKAGGLLESARQNINTLKSAGDLQDAQGPYNQAKSEIQSCIRYSHTVCKQIDFFETKIEDATSALSEMQSLLDNITQKYAQTQPES